MILNFEKQYMLNLAKLNIDFAAIVLFVILVVFHSMVKEMLEECFCCISFSTLECDFGTGTVIVRLFLLHK